MLSSSAPLTSSNCAGATIRCRNPFFAHIEQLHSVTRSRSAVTRNRTRPQWQPPCILCMDIVLAEPSRGRSHAVRANGVEGLGMSCFHSLAASTHEAIASCTFFKSFLRYFTVGHAPRQIGHGREIATAVILRQPLDTNCIFEFHRASP